MTTKADTITLARVAQHYGLKVRPHWGDCWEDNFLDIDGYMLYPPDKRREVDPDKWVLQIVVTIPGCWTLPNGDPGYPDEMDYDDIGSYDRVEQALEALLTHHIKETISNISFDEGMALENEEEFLREAAEHDAQEAWDEAHKHRIPRGQKKVRGAKPADLR